MKSISVLAISELGAIVTQDALHRFVKEKLSSRGARSISSLGLNLYFCGIFYKLDVDLRKIRAGGIWKNVFAGLSAPDPASTFAARQPVARR